jgi:hypothetical protein
MTTTVLAQAIMRKRAKALAAGIRPVDLKLGIDAVVKDIERRSNAARRNLPIRRHGVEAEPEPLFYRIGIGLFSETLMFSERPYKC